jgi:hypothetical protein
MTFLRKIAMAISNRVVRWASPVCKDWAEGLAREVEFIESDWRALAWAVGSTRVLLGRSLAPAQSLSEIPNATRTLMDQRRTWTGAFILGMESLLRWNGAMSPSRQFGCFLIAFVAIVAGVNWLIERRRFVRQWTDEVYGNIRVCAPFYKAELERLRSQVWNRMALAVCVWVGAALSQQGGVHGDPFGDATCVVGCSVCVLMFFWYQRKISRQVQTIDMLLEETGGVTSL